MIIVQIVGGLGNQMFEFAFAEALRHHHQTALYLDITSYKNYADRQYDLACFHVSVPLATPRMLRRFYPAAGKKQKLERFIQQCLKGKGVVLEEQQDEAYRFSKRPFQTYSQDIFVKGYWQSYRYFEKHEQQIRALFTFKNVPNEQNNAMIRQIKDKQMVSLHIRRGDYVQNPTVNASHGVCSLEYYQKATELLAQKITNPHFLVFSDDIAWCQAHLNLGFETSFVDYPNPNYEDMRLMSLCQHHIIANSSFSWWGAWLNSSPDKIVIAPKRWMANRDLNTSDLLPSSWLKL